MLLDRITLRRLCHARDVLSGASDEQAPSIHAIARAIARAIEIAVLSDTCGNLIQLYEPSAA